MTIKNKSFPYTVDIVSLYGKETLQGFRVTTWEVIVQWLDSNLLGEWVYYGGFFRFATERAKLLFLLRWTL